MVKYKTDKIKKREYITFFEIVSIISVDLHKMDETESIVASSTNNDLPRNYRKAFLELDEHFGRNSFGICCKKFTVTPHARDVTIEEHLIYIANLWTLVERRWPTQKSLPYTGNESCPDSPVGDIWQDYEFDPPVRTVLSPSSKSLSRDLDKTRRQEECSSCENNEQVACSRCNGRGYIVTWTQLNVKWFNNYSKIIVSCNNDGSCPQSIIDLALKRIQCLEFDDTWPSTRTTLDDILDTCHDLPEGLRNEMNKKFLEHQQADKILRLKCDIERVKIDKINYCLNGIEGKEINIKDFL
jgi:hypothetical protein